jgi:hypothetical protein
LNFATDADLWPAFEEGNLWIIRGGQADIVSNTDGLKIDGALAEAKRTRSNIDVGNIRIVDTVEGLDLSGVDVAYIDMAGATGTPSALPGHRRRAVSSSCAATRRPGSSESSAARGCTSISDLDRLRTSIDAALEALQPRGTTSPSTSVDFGAINLGGGMFTAIVRQRA